MKRKARVAFLTIASAEDRTLWSGTPSYMYESLKEEFGDVILLGPYRGDVSGVQRIVNAVKSRTISVINRASFFFFKKKYTSAGFLSTIYAQFFNKELSEKGPFDLIIAVAAPIAVGKLKTKTPIFTVSDATIKLLSSYYGTYEFKKTLNELVHVERLALEKSTMNIYSSSWAGDSALLDYNVPDSKVRIIPFGANLERSPKREDILKTKFTYKLLFLGVDWERKGGPIAFECLKALISLGIKVELIVCGCIPPDAFKHDCIRVIPFLNKNKPDDYKKLISLLEESDFLLLPTRAECYGMVFCEASAYGMPSITTDTGGVGTAVENGINGFRLPVSATGKDYAELIASIYSDLEGFKKLSVTTRDKYEKELNWSSWSSSIRDIYEAFC